MLDCLIVGGGVIGLSLAYELVGHGMRVRVIDRGAIGREASWAGAGILPAAVERPDDPPELQLAGLSSRLHGQWSVRLRAATRIDDGFRRCGGIYVARDEQAAAELTRHARQQTEQGIRCERLSIEAMLELEPALRVAERSDVRALTPALSRREEDFATAYLAPDDCQLRNPRRLKALQVACSKQGVEISPGVAAEDFDIHQGRVERVLTSTGPIAAGAVCLATGSWSAGVARRLGVSIEVAPVRGQMVLLAGDRPQFGRVMNEGPRYLVPRDDGRVLVGSTEEDAGFDRRTTAQGIAGLLAFALALCPSLAGLNIERTWAGLRPGAVRGLPYLGRARDLENAFLATGHFRSGLHLSTGTARLVGQLIRGERPEVDLRPFAL